MSFRAALALGLALQMACVPKITERCLLVTNPSPPPALPAGFAELDALLLRRATDMTLASRGLDSSLVIIFHRDFAELLLPALCQRLEQARVFAMAGRATEAGRAYQALLISSQVLAFAVAIHAMAQYADRRVQAGGQISRTQEKFASEAAPILTAALSEDPREIERALAAHPGVFASWAELLERWPAHIDDGARKAEVAKVVWDIAFLMVAVYEAAGAAAEIVAAGRPPLPPVPAFATAGGAAAVSYTGPAALEAAEALRKLIASGALDAALVAALSRPIGGGAPLPPRLPNAAQMSANSRVGDSRVPAEDGQPAEAKAADNVTKRPSSFRKQTVQGAWDNASPGSKSGSKACSTCGKDADVAPGKGRRDWDVDHQPKWKDRDLTGKTRQEVLDGYNEDVRLRCPSCNRSDNQ